MIEQPSHLRWPDDEPHDKDDCREYAAPDVLRCQDSKNAWSRLQRGLQHPEYYCHELRLAAFSGYERSAHAAIFCWASRHE